jgi:hypothetical protein
VADLKPIQPTEGITLSRWSRLKRAAAAEQAALATVHLEPVEGPLAPEPGLDALSLNDRVGATQPNRDYDQLPPLSAISLTEDFTPFMQAKVPQALKQQALKALFKEPHFNVMDGLDIYIDDYTVFEPISPEVMATLSSWKAIMNPTKQVVTPGGYAVDVQSDEGKAVLAEEARLAEATAIDVLPQVPNSTATDAQPEAEIIEPESAVVSAKPHPRYGTRVGDFSPAEHSALEVVPPETSTTEREIFATAPFRN